MRIRNFFTKKRIIWTTIIVLVLGGIGYGVFGRDNSADKIQTDTVKRQDIKSTILATGQVVSSTDLGLSFKTSGIVQSVKVSEGSKVKAGDVLANLDQKDAVAGLTSARGSLAQAQANYNKVLAGASNEEIVVAQKAVDAAQVTLDTAKINFKNTQIQQDTAVSNAYSALLNSTLSAVPASGNIGSGTAEVSGTYIGTEQGVYKIVLYNSGSGLMFQYSGLETGNGDRRTAPVTLGSKGLFIEFSGTSYAGDTWTVTIPNTSASNYVANYNAYLAAKNTQQSSVDAAQAQMDSATVALAQGQANLDLKKAKARPADLQAAEAQIISAQGQVLAAQAVLENTIIRAPAAGTITSVDIKVGELATAQTEVIILQDVTSLHVEADVSEGNIAKLLPGQKVDITFDALGPDRHFEGSVLTVNPGATVVSGVVNYEIKAWMGKIEGIKPGMTANLTVLADQKNSVLAIPLRAVINRDGKKYVRVIDNSEKKTYHETEVQTGLEADAGLVEIISGLSEGQEVVTFIKQ